MDNVTAFDVWIVSFCTFVCFAAAAFISINVLDWMRNRKNDSRRRST